MRYDPTKHHRRSIRLKGYDYSQAGAYFITIVTQDRACLFGEVVDGAMRLNEYGRIVEFTWHDLVNHVTGIVLDTFVVMPNHVHGIVIITDAPDDVTVGAGSEPAPTATNPAPTATKPAPTTTNLAPTITKPAPTTMEPAPTATKPAPATMEPAPTTTEPAPTTTDRAPTITTTAKPKRHALPEIIRQFKTFSARRINQCRQTANVAVWQRNYYEHIVRDEHALNRIRRYILDNPARWAFDRENPTATTPEPEDAWAQ
ncbi:hypothetical protein SE15_13880 [Thermanaerothrix daxensis]|uniref:Transposase IS200-like domain-containing protein n=1 Tax=Thermanaerothrix daxensis TaxID=869279 RepID=A0A0P6Y011_9CHLR|nr:transposase [Thermanaerothrix daxensis]KPL82164.1 hypothetical protein SE15_13880 [Thermanaerothrix daxensis]